MKKIISLSLLLATIGFADMQDAEILAEKKCGECHLMGVTSKEKLDKMKAPPYWAIARKTKEAFATNEERVKFIVDYTFNPKEEKMLFAKDAKTRFGLMPSQEGKVSKEEIELISTYILRMVED